MTQGKILTMLERAAADVHMSRFLCLNMDLLKSKYIRNNIESLLCCVGDLHFLTLS